MRRKFIWILLMGEMVLALGACSGAHESKEDLATAERAGRLRALALHPDSIAKLGGRGLEPADNPAIQSTLLDIRRRERTLREGKHNRTADAYINSFLATLDSINPELARAMKE